MATRNDIFKEHLSSYLKADRGKKGEILKHVCFVTGMHRKAVISKFRNLQCRYVYKKGRRGRSTVYISDVTLALKEVWRAGNEVCAELLHPVVGEYIDILHRDGIWKHDSGI